MKENFVTGTSKHPESPEAVLRIPNAYQPPAEWNKHRQEAGITSKEGAILVQTEGGDNSWKSRQDCFKCGKPGHIARECPEKEGKQEQMHVNVEVDTGMEDEDLGQGENIFLKKNKGGVVNKNWLILLSTHLLKPGKL